MKVEVDIEGISDRDFQRIARLAQTEVGIDLPTSKRGMIQSRIFRHMRRAKFRDGLSNYIDAILSDEKRRAELISILTTNVTGFFREPHHFETLASELAERHAEPGQRLRIWSAGCSAGHEPYTIAMTLFELWPDLKNRDLRILATDIDPEILATAREGVYSERELSKLPREALARFFLPLRPAEAEPASFRVKPELASLIAFRELNLHADWPMQGPFDAIFCRNVVIYFAEETRAALWPRFHDMLVPGGLLFIGHSERIQSPQSNGFEPAGVTTFRKVAT